MTTPTRRTSRVLAGIGVAAIAVALGLVTAAPAYAASFNVTDGSSSGPGTLTQAIIDLNTSGTAGTINIAPGLVINMGAISTQVHESVVVVGDASNPPTIQGPTIAAPIFQMSLANLSIEVDNVDMIGQSTGGSAITLSGGSGNIVLVGDSFNNFRHPAVELLLQTGDLTVTSCTFGGNASTAASADGGAIVAGAVHDVNITNSRFLNNSADHHGGALFLGAANSVNISGTTFTGNHATDDGGAVEISSLSSDSTWQGDTFTNNSVGATNNIGGAAFMITTVFADVTFTIDQSTFSGNSATSGVVPARGGVGYVNDVEGTVLVGNSTMTGNSFTGTATGSGLDLAVGIIGDTGELDVLQSTFEEAGAANPLILAGSNNNFLRLGSSTFFGPGVLRVVANSNAAANAVEARDVIAISTDATPAFDVTGTPAIIGYSITSDTANAQLVGLLGMHFGVADPQLAPLANNGGLTQTRLPLTGSLAIDAGDPGFTVPLTDQRGTGFPRIINGRVDIGSVEGISSTPTLAATGTDPAQAVWSATTTLAAGGLLLGALVLWRRRNTAQQAAGRR